MKWIEITKDSKPPEEMLKVKDEFGNVANAIPCYYNFNIVNGKVVFCEETFDGWMIDSSYKLENVIKGKITHYGTK